MDPGEREQNMSTQNIPLWYKNDLELIILRNSRHKGISENQVEITLLKETFMFIRKISICKDTSLSDPGRVEDEEISRNSYRLRRLLT